jgi:hypothetical protein
LNKFVERHISPTTSLGALMLSLLHDDPEKRPSMKQVKVCEFLIIVSKDFWYVARL